MKLDELEKWLEHQITVCETALRETGRWAHCDKEALKSEIAAYEKTLGQLRGNK